MAIEKMVQQERIAMDKISGYDQAQVDEMLYVISKAVFEQAEPLAKLAIEETRLGRLDHKIGKNQGMATTNPTITLFGNGLMALKGRNAMIVSPHPRSKKTTK